MNNLIFLYVDTDWRSDSKEFILTTSRPMSQREAESAIMAAIRAYVKNLNEQDRAIFNTPSARPTPLWVLSHLTHEDLAPFDLAWTTPHVVVELDNDWDPRLDEQGNPL